MIQLRALLDEAETIVPADEWTIATYKELLFMDQHHSHATY
jgi:glutamine synthetase